MHYLPRFQAQFALSATPPRFSQIKRKPKIHSLRSIEARLLSQFSHNIQHRGPGMSTEKASLPVEPNTFQVGSLWTHENDVINVISGRLDQMNETRCKVLRNEGKL